MVKTPEKERYFYVFTWYFIVIMFVYVIVNNGLINPSFKNLLKSMIFLGIFGIVNLIKGYLLKVGLYEFDYFYLRSRLIDVILICFSFFYFGFNVWVVGFIVGIVILTTLLEGKRRGLHTFLLAFMLALSFMGFSDKNQIENISFMFFLLVGIAGWYVTGIISDEINDFQKRKESQIKELENQRNQAQERTKELEIKGEKMKEKLKKLEQTNEELKVSLNKYYEFHHMSSIINSIFDIHGLLKFVNETILEIIEVDYSTIFLFEPKRGSLEVQHTNIIEEEILLRLRQGINNDIIFDIIENGTLFVNNFVDSSEQFEFILDPEVKSFVCLPISTTKKKYGMVLVESKQYNKFDEENQKLLNLIGNQLAAAIENLELYKKMRELATTDGLTGVYNRLYFQERLTKELRIAHENGYPLSLVIFDIDHFKKINDTYSHLVGDKVLRVVASIVKNSIRRSDIIARYGGEEFVILFPNMDINRAEETSEILRKRIQAAQILERDVGLVVTASFGVANYPENALSGENLIKAADRALYQAKEAGRNCVKVSGERFI